LELSQQGTAAARCALHGVCWTLHVVRRIVMLRAACCVLHGVRTTARRRYRSRRDCASERARSARRTRSAAPVRSVPHTACSADRIGAHIGRGGERSGWDRGRDRGRVYIAQRLCTGEGVPRIPPVRDRDALAARILHLLPHAHSATATTLTVALALAHIGAPARPTDVCGHAPGDDDSSS
jgi:hypothetical protein